MIRSLFEEIEADDEHTYEVSMTYVQIWLEKIYDLLAEHQFAANGREWETPLKLREDKKGGLFIQVCAKSTLVARCALASVHL